MALSQLDRDDLEGARARLEGVYQRTSQVETRRALEAVQRVLDRDAAVKLPPTVHHHRPMRPTPGWAGG